MRETYFDLRIAAVQFCSASEIFVRGVQGWQRHLSTNLLEPL
jgi:hypothetical protein